MAPVRKSFSMQVNAPSRKRGRPKRTLIEAVKDRPNKEQPITKFGP